MDKCQALAAISTASGAVQYRYALSELTALKLCRLSVCPSQRCGDGVLLEVHGGAEFHYGYGRHNLYHLIVVAKRAMLYDVNSQRQHCGFYRVHFLAPTVALSTLGRVRARARTTLALTAGPRMHSCDKLLQLCDDPRATTGSCRLLVRAR